MKVLQNTKKMEKADFEWSTKSSRTPKITLTLHYSSGWAEAAKLYRNKRNRSTSEEEKISLPLL